MDTSVVKLGVIEVKNCFFTLLLTYSVYFIVSITRIRVYCQLNNANIKVEQLKNSIFEISLVAVMSSCYTR